MIKQLKLQKKHLRIVKKKEKNITKQVSFEILENKNIHNNDGRKIVIRQIF